ncbi:MAG: hypothetical protein AABX48_01165 [Nanoarchaeota archaeon]
MENTSLHEDVRKLRKDVELIKNILMSEGELSSWAKKEMIKARKEKEADYTDLEDL